MKKKCSSCTVMKSLWLQLCIITIVYSITTVCVGFPSLFGAVHGNEMAANCGVNVTAFTLGYFHKPVNISRVAQALHAGNSWDKAPNMLQIKRTLMMSGLKIAAYKDATLTDVFKQMAVRPQRSLSIIFIKNNLNLGRLGHYLVLLDCGPQHFFVVDIGDFIGRESVNLLNDRIGPNFSGLFLLVTPGGAPLASKPYPITDKEIELRIGEIASGPGIIQIPFWLKNTIKKPIHIAMAKGTCYCFHGAKIIGHGGMIAPGQIGKIIMAFKRNLIGVGNIEREVLFSFVGYPNHFLRVVVYAHMTTAHPPVQLTWYPQAINLGLVRNNSVLGGQEFTVLTPKTVSLQAPTVSSKDIQVIRLNGSAGKSQVDDFGRTAHEFVVDLSNLPAGEVDQKVTIRTTDKYIPKIVIPITGRVDK